MKAIYHNRWLDFLLFHKVKSGLNLVGLCILNFILLTNIRMLHMIILYSILLKGEENEGWGFSC